MSYPSLALRCDMLRVGFNSSGESSMSGYPLQANATAGVPAHFNQPGHSIARQPGVFFRNRWKVILVTAWKLKFRGRFWTFYI